MTGHQRLQTLWTCSVGCAASMAGTRAGRASTWNDGYIQGVSGRSSKPGVWRCEKCTETSRAVCTRAISHMAASCSDISRRSLLGATAIAWGSFQMAQPAHASLVKFPATELQNKYILVRTYPLSATDAAHSRASARAILCPSPCAALAMSEPTARISQSAAVAKCVDRQAAVVVACPSDSRRHAVARRRELC